MRGDVTRRGYWCECWSEDLTGQRRPARLGALDAYTARQADRWIADTLRTVFPLLDGTSSDEAWHWLREGRVNTRLTLLRSEPCTVSVAHADVRLVWTIRPVAFLALASFGAPNSLACFWLRDRLTE